MFRPQKQKNNPNPAPIRATVERELHLAGRSAGIAVQGLGFNVRAEQRFTLALGGSGICINLKFLKV